MDLLFNMVKTNGYGRVGGFNPFSGILGEEHRSVLASSASEGDHQVVEMPFQVVVNALAYDGFDMFKEKVGLGFLIQVFHHFPVATGFVLELRLPSRVRQGTAVEDETASITAIIIGVTFLE